MKFLKKIDPEDIKVNYSSGQDINLVLPNSIVDLHSFTLYYDYQYDCQNPGTDGVSGYNNLWRSLPSLSSCIVDELRIIIDGKEVSYIQEYAYLDSLLHDIHNDNYVYNNRGNLIYIENSDGYWIKYDYDDDGNQIYYENSDGIWYKQEYDNDGNKLYYKDSSGYIIDYR